MTSSQILSQSLRFLLLLFLQTLVLKNLPLAKVNPYLYPLALLLLPLEISHTTLVAIGFFYGLSIDLFYDTLGLHAGVMAFIGFIRPYICHLIEPRGGYEIGQTLTPARLGWSWFVRYASLMFFISILLITLGEELSFSLAWLMRFLLSLPVSLLCVLLYQFIFNPK